MKKYHVNVLNDFLYSMEVVYVLRQFSHRIRLLDHMYY
jgi:hypothetical protein